MAVGVCSMPRQLDHGKHVVAWTLLFLYMYQCRSEGWIILKGDCTKRQNKTMSCKNKIPHSQRMRHLPRHPPHGTAGPNTGGNVCLSNRCSIESMGTFTETNNQAAWRAFTKWLKHSSKHSNETSQRHPKSQSFPNWTN